MGGYRQVTFGSKPFTDPRLLGNTDGYFGHSLCAGEKGTSPIIGGLGRGLDESMAMRWTCNSDTLTKDARCL